MTTEGTISPLDTLAWPGTRLGEAMAEVASRAGLARRTTTLPPPPGSLFTDAERVDVWLTSAAQYLGIEAEAVEIGYSEVDALLRSRGPVVLRMAGMEPRFVALIGGRHSVAILGPDLTLHRVARARVAAALVAPLHAGVYAEVGRWLDAARVHGRRRQKACLALLRQRIGNASIGPCWLLREAPGGSITTALYRLGAIRRLGLFLLAHMAQIIMSLAAWGIIGQIAFSDHVERGWLSAVFLLLALAIPFHLLQMWASGWVALDVGAKLKQHLLQGALRLSPEVVRRDGAGRHLGRVIETEALEATVLGGTASGAVALMELVTSAIMLAIGPGGVVHLFLLVGWCGLGAIMISRWYRRRSAWTQGRLELTHALVERMVGHQTRLAQEPPECWHDGEDLELAAHLERGREMDRDLRVLVSLQNHGWLLVGLTGLVPAFLAGHASPSALALGLGGVLLGQRALQQITASFAGIADVAIGWHIVQPLFEAAKAADAPGAGLLALAPQDSGGEFLIEGNDLVFRYSSRGQPVLRGCSVAMRAGDQILLEGPSGGGKSTLGALIAGLRAPESGLLLWQGIDSRTIGADTWPRRVAASPQFHENHVLTGTLAFNLLMGRRWPPTSRDLEQADAVCRALDLGPLLDRMPSGMQQIVGETGWQLSHGERSRIFLARALLQRADLIVLDESFSSLDPETLRSCVLYVLERAPTVLVIAHP